MIFATLFIFAVLEKILSAYFCGDGKKRDRRDVCVSVRSDW